MQIESGWKTAGLLTDRLIDSLKQVAELHFSLAMATVQQANFATRQWMAAGQPQHFVPLAASQLESEVQRLLDYGYYLTGIASVTLVDMTKIAGSVAADTSNRMRELAEDADHAVPSGCKAADYIIRQLISLVGAACDELMKFAQHAARTLRSEP